MHLKSYCSKQISFVICCDFSCSLSIPEPVKMISQAQFLPVKANVDVKAVKEDDAGVPVHLWNDILISTYPAPSVLDAKSRQFLCTALNKFRNFTFRIWFQYVYLSFMRYFQNQRTTGTQLYLDINGPLDTSQASSEDFCKYVEAGIYCFHLITKCSWWQWNNGSRILLWRCTPKFRIFA